MRETVRWFKALYIHYCWGHSDDLHQLLLIAALWAKTKQHVKYFCVPVWAEMLTPQLWFRRVLRFCVLTDCDRKSTDLEKLYNIFPTVAKKVAVTRISCKFKTFRSNVICVILQFECDTLVCHSDRLVTSLQVGLCSRVCVCVCVRQWNSPACK